MDRSGLAAKNAVSVEVGITKPWEAVFEGISQIIAGPRDSENSGALAIEFPDASTESADAATESGDNEVVGEFDEDEIDDDLPRIGEDRERESESVIDVEVIEPEGVFVGDHPAALTPDADDSSLSGALSPGPLGPTGPAGSGLMTLEDGAGRRGLRTALRQPET